MAVTSAPQAMPPQHLWDQKQRVHISQRTEHQELPSPALLRIKMKIQNNEEIDDAAEF